MKITSMNKKIASILLSGTILITSGCTGKVVEQKETSPLNPIQTEKMISEIPTSTPVQTETIKETPMPILSNAYAYVLNDTLIYDNKKMEDSSYYIESYQKVLIKEAKKNYALVEYTNENNEIKKGYIYLKDLGLLPSKYVEIDISDQIVNLYNQNQNILTSNVVTGKESTPTRIGYFDIDYKEYDTYLKGADYCSHVYYWMPFDGGIGLHDAAWRDTFGGDIYVYGGSHGCVNLDNETAKTIYDNVEVGTRVLVHK